MNFYNVFCDLDGVLVDLDAGFHAVRGETLASLRNVGDSKWKEALEVPRFWETLPKMPECDIILKYLFDTFNEAFLNILSAPQHLFKTCEEEKHSWVRTHAPRFFTENIFVVPREDKQKFAVNHGGVPNLLIDDYEKNINEWREAGGIGIHHTCPVQTIAQIEMLI